mmetsp:Transcript_65005/g.150991  ORF Transcript_65005/g.150991 Transcript_65005/m.150991 type:complete len:146 (-) Transcript_65005:199-636(-)
MYQPREVVVRELDGLPFAVVLLRVRDGVADVAYLDDGNIETDVPIDELIDASDIDVATFEVDPIQRWEEGLGVLAAEEAEACASPSRPATASDMHWEQGRYVTEDGAVVLSTAPDGLAGPAACGAGIRGIRCLRKCREQAQPVLA